MIVRVCVGKWQAIIHHDGERKPLGYFDDEQEAAQTFDAAARRLRGDDAHGGYAGFNKLRLNLPTPREAQRAKQKGVSALALKRAIGQKRIMAADEIRTAA